MLALSTMDTMGGECREICKRGVPCKCLQLKVKYITKEEKDINVTIGGRWAPIFPGSIKLLDDAMKMFELEVSVPAGLGRNVDVVVSRNGQEGKAEKAHYRPPVIENMYTVSEFSNILPTSGGIVTILGRGFGPWSSAKSNTAVNFREGEFAEVDKAKV